MKMFDLWYSRKKSWTDFTMWWYILTLYGIKIRFCRAIVRRSVGCTILYIKVRTSHQRRFYIFKSPAKRPMLTSGCTRLFYTLSVHISPFFLQHHFSIILIQKVIHIFNSISYIASANFMCIRIWIMMIYV